MKKTLITIALLVGGYFLFGQFQPKQITSDYDILQATNHYSTKYDFTQAFPENPSLEQMEKIASIINYQRENAASCACYHQESWTVIASRLHRYLTEDDRYDSEQEQATGRGARLKALYDYVDVQQQRPSYATAGNWSTGRTFLSADLGKSISDWWYNVGDIVTEETEGPNGKRIVTCYKILNSDGDKEIVDCPKK